MSYTELPLNNTNLFIRSLEYKNSAQTITTEELTLLADVYNMKGKAIGTFLGNDAEAKDQIMTIGYAMERFLSPAVTRKPFVQFAEDEKLETYYTVFGQTIKFKVETGSVTNVIDAEPEWDLSQEDQDIAMEAYKEYVKKHPDDGAMTKENLLELSPKYHNINFGTVTGFNMTVYRKEKDIEERKIRGEDAPDEVIYIEGPFEVVAISSPTKKGSEGKAPIPVILARFIDPESGEEIETTIALKPRNMTTRGLLSRNFINTKAKLTLLPYDENLETMDMINLEKVDYDAIRKVLQPA